MDGSSTLSPKNDVRAFKENHLREWVVFLDASQDRPDMPPIDDAWYTIMLDYLQVMLNRPDCRIDTHAAGASLFYKAVKNHRRIDGNKRSAVIVIYLFYLINDHHIIADHHELYLFAKNVAENRLPQEACEHMIKVFLTDNSTPLLAST